MQNDGVLYSAERGAAGGSQVGVGEGEVEAVEVGTVVGVGGELDGEAVGGAEAGCSGAAIAGGSLCK